MVSYNSGVVSGKNHSHVIHRDFAGTVPGSLPGFTEAQRGAMAQAIQAAFLAMELDKSGALGSNFTVVASVVAGSSFSLTIS